MWHRVVSISHVDFLAVIVTSSWRPYLTLVPGIAIESHFAVDDTSVGFGPICPSCYATVTRELDLMHRGMPLTG
jgi:hypothetical protein